MVEYRTAPVVVRMVSYRTCTIIIVYPGGKFKKTPQRTRYDNILLLSWLHTTQCILDNIIHCGNKYILASG